MKGVVENIKKASSKRKSDTNNNHDELKTKYGKNNIVRTAAEFFGSATLLPTTISYDSTILPDAIFLTNASGQLITTPVNSIPTSILQEKTNTTSTEQQPATSEESLNLNNVMKKQHKNNKKTELLKNAAATSSSSATNKKKSKVKPSASLQLSSSSTSTQQFLQLIPSSGQADNFPIKVTQPKTKTQKNQKHSNNNATTKKKKKASSKSTAPPIPTIPPQTIIKGLPSLSHFTNIATLPSIHEAVKLKSPLGNGITLRLAASPPPPPPPLSGTADLVIPATATSFDSEEETKLPESPTQLLPETIHTPSTISPPSTPNLITTQLLPSPPTPPALTTSAFVFTNGITQKDNNTFIASAETPQTFSGATFANFPLLASGLTAGSLAGFAAQTNFTTFSLQAPLLAPGLTIPLYNSLLTVSTKEGLLPALNKEIIPATKPVTQPTQKATKTSKKKNNLTTNLTSSGAQNGNDMTTSRGRKRTAQSRLPAKLKEPAAVARRNARERRRVKMVNDGFLRLRRHVPTDPKNKKLSKVKTLRLAIEYIHHLQDLLQSDSTTKQTQQSIMTSFTAQVSEADYDDLEVDGDDIEAESWLQSNSLNRVDQELDEDIFTAVDPARLRTTYTEFVTR
eukprot:TCONS_00030873-protein